MKTRYRACPWQNCGWPFILVAVYQFSITPIYLPFSNHQFPLAGKIYNCQSQAVSLRHRGTELSFKLELTKRARGSSWHHFPGCPSGYLCSPLTCFWNQHPPGAMGSKSLSRLSINMAASHGSPLPLLLWMSPTTAVSYWQGLGMPSSCSDFYFPRCSVICHTRFITLDLGSFVEFIFPKSYSLQKFSLL